MVTCDFPGCGAQYRRKEHLTRHAKKHYPTGQRLVCDICGKGFDRNDSLRRHKAVHLRDANGSTKVRACDQCYNGKRRCNGEKPCDGCLKRGVECTFERENVADRVGTETEPVLSREEMEGILAQHEDSLREQGLLTVGCSGTGARGTSEGLDIEHYIGIYFAHFHHQWPLIHRPSFQPSKEPQLLRLTLAMIGLWSTGEKAARERAVGMHEKLIALLEDRQDDWKLDCEFKDQRWPVTTYQTIILNIIFTIIRDAPKPIHDRFRKLLEAVTTTCKTGNLFNHETMLAQIEPTDSVLYSWTYIEEVKRLALTIFKLNYFFGTLLLAMSDLRFPLPDPGYLWDAPETKEFYRRYQSQLESGTVNEELICNIVKDVHQEKRGPGVLFQADIWLGLLS